MSYIALKESLLSPLDLVPAIFFHIFCISLLVKFPFSVPFKDSTSNSATLVVS